MFDLHDASQPKIDNVLQLNSSHYVCKGGRKMVFTHPYNHQLLIKVLLPKVANAWYKKFNFKATKPLTRELTTYIDLQYKNKKYHFFQTIYGFVTTNYGFGIIVKAYKNEYGQLAKTLEHMIHNDTFTQTMLKDLQHFFVACYRVELPITDLTLQNIIYAYCPKRSAYRFILVDGLGDKRWIQFGGNFYYRRSLMKQIKVISNQISHHCGFQLGLIDNWLLEAKLSLI